MSDERSTPPWDERGPCNGPRDCVGTDRGCVVCDPGGPEASRLEAAVEALRALPVEERMDAMGMVPAALYGKGLWMEDR